MYSTACPSQRLDGRGVLHPWMMKNRSPLPLNGSKTLVYHELPNCTLRHVATPDDDSKTTAFSGCPIWLMIIEHLDWIKRGRKIGKPKEGTEKIANNITADHGKPGSRRSAGVPFSQRKLHPLEQMTFGRDQQGSGPLNDMLTVALFAEPFSPGVLLFLHRQLRLVVGCWLFWSLFAIAHLLCSWFGFGPVVRPGIAKSSD